MKLVDPGRLFFYVVFLALVVSSAFNFVQYMTITIQKAQIQEMRGAVEAIK